MPRRLAPVLPVALCAAAAVLLLAACGGSSSPSAGAAARAQEPAVKFARCLREHGINASTPSGSPGGLIKVTGAGGRKSFEAAQNACKRYRPAPPNLSPAEQIAHLDAALKFARCVRSHGVDVPDPKAGGGGIQIKLRGGPGGPGGPNPSSATFQAAQSACQSDLPGGGPKFRPGGPPPFAKGRGGGAYNAEMHLRG